MDENRLKLAFVGDVCLSFFGQAPYSNADFPEWPAVQQEIGERDFLVGNLECCLVDERLGERKLLPWTAVPTDARYFLKEVGFTDLCLANNHSMDCGPEAIPVAHECLASVGIRAFGAGSSLAEAEAPVFGSCNGRTVAFLGACDRSEYYAASYRAGIAPLEKRRLGQRVRTAARKADLVVVTLHADLEFCEVPGLWRQRLSRWLVDQGAHLVIQHHPHVLQGIESYRGGIIAYSLGNFIFKLHGNCYQETQSGVFDTLALIVEADFTGAAPKLTYRTIPLRIGDNHMPRTTSGNSCEEALQRIRSLSSKLANRRACRQAWFRRCRQEAIARMRGAYYAFRRGNFKSGARMLGALLICREDRRWMLGLASWGYL